MNKIYSTLLAATILTGICQIASAGDELPELLPLNNVNVNKIMNIKQGVLNVQKATKTELYQISDENLNYALSKKARAKKQKAELKQTKAFEREAQEQTAREAKELQKRGEMIEKQAKKYSKELESKAFQEQKTKLQAVKAEEKARANAFKAEEKAKAEAYKAEQKRFYKQLSNDAKNKQLEELRLKNEALRRERAEQYKILKDPNAIYTPKRLEQEKRNDEALQKVVNDAMKERAKKTGVAPESVNVVKQNFDEQKNIREERQESLKRSLRGESEAQKQAKLQAQTQNRAIKAENEARARAIKAENQTNARAQKAEIETQKQIQKEQIERAKLLEKERANAIKQEKKTKAAVNKKADKILETPETVAVESKKITRSEKKEEKKKQQYKAKFGDYLLPTDAYMPVGNTEDKSTKITGSIQKTLEFNLADCLELALLNNPKVKAAYANAKAERAVKNQTLSNYSPRVDIRAGISRMKPDSSALGGGHLDSYTKYLLGTIGVKQLVYDFGVTQNQYTIDKLSWESSKTNIEAVVNDVICNVKDSYYNLLFALARKQVAVETVEQYQQMYNQARAFYQVGSKPKVDVTIASSNLADAKANLIEATSGVEIAVSKLNNAMGLPFVPPYVVDTSISFEDFNLSMKEAVEIANDNRPDLKMLLIGVEQANQYTKLAKKTYFPSLEFQGNWSMGGRHDFSDTTWYDAGGYLTFPVINPFMIKNEVAQANALYEKQKFDTKSSVNDIYFEIQQAYVLLTDAKERIPASKLFVKEAKESYELSRGRYRVGVCDAIEFRDAQVQYANAKLAYISALYAYNSAKAKLEKAIGKSLAPFGKKENVEI